ncbi:E3 ubiquitin-protein ligase RNF25 [Pseudophryne corroboree]|uniref:E3 ubiquitin-protein ligase RNF25 n=1 Tax=Pseudophryne corroboree TaxID=495146 RepID=UPI003081BDAA
MAEEEETGSVLQELQVLQSIYLEELEVSEEDGLVLRITLHPATGDDLETQYVRLTLQLSLPSQYPEEPPEISVSNPRGLCDEQIQSIINTLHVTATQSAGCPVLYQLIEKGKEMLTSSNIPRGHCVICLYEFQEGDSLTKTTCFHHFHSHCLGRYAKHCRDNSLGKESVVICPVCRENLTCDLSKLQDASPPQQPEELYVPDTCTLQREKELRQVYERQLANGGIIDLEAEKNRFFISIQETPASDLQVPQEDQVSAEPTAPAAVSRMEPPPLLCLSKQHRGGHRPGVKTPLNMGGRSFHHDHPDGQPWQNSRGWAAHNRWRSDTRRLWREEAVSRDTQTHTRGRVKGRNCRTTETVQPPQRDSTDSSLEEQHAL